MQRGKNEKKIKQEETQKNNKKKLDNKIQQFMA